MSRLRWCLLCLLCLNYLIMYLYNAHVHVTLYKYIARLVYRASAQYAVCHWLRQLIFALMKMSSNIVVLFYPVSVTDLCM